MRRRHSTLWHGGRCRCERCRFQDRIALLALFLLAIVCGCGAVLLGAWPRMSNPKLTPGSVPGDTSQSGERR